MSKQLACDVKNEKMRTSEERARSVGGIPARTGLRLRSGGRRNESEGLGQVDYRPVEDLIKERTISSGIVNRARAAGLLGCWECCRGGEFPEGR